MRYIYANWKSHKNIIQAREWMQVFLTNISEGSKKALSSRALEVGIFPPSPLLYPVHEMLKGESGIIIGAQDVSRYAEGKHTGLVNASSLSGIATHAIVGHAEMRLYGDTQSVVYEKFARAQDALIIPIVCMRKNDEYIDDAQIVVYEPEYAIGSGIVATPDEIRKFRSSLPDKKDQVFLYGGSVNDETVISLISQNICDGFLVGAASLDPIAFANLINRTI